MTKTTAKARKSGQQAAQAEADRLKALGVLTTLGTVCGASVIEAFQSNLMGRETRFYPVYESLDERVHEIQGGDLRMLEEMLFSQAAALQTIFSSLARKAASQEYLAQYQTFLGLALRAQAQSRATIEALVELKQPRQQPTFVQQANITSGPQQINNGPTAESREVRTGALTPAGQNPGMESELLEQHGNFLDTRTSSSASGDDPHLEAVGAVNRPPHASRQGEGV